MCVSTILIMPVAIFFMEKNCGMEQKKEECTEQKYKCEYLWIKVMTRIFSESERERHKSTPSPVLKPVLTRWLLSSSTDHCS